MALPTVPGTKFSIGDIAAEFTGATPHALSEYYRGGTYVPNTQRNLNIPTKGEIAISDFYGSNKDGVSLLSTHIVKVSAGSTAYTGQANATFQLQSNGAATGITNVTNSVSDWYSLIDASSTQTNPRTVNFTNEWLVTGTASNYDVYATWAPNSTMSPTATLAGSAQNAWLNLGTTRTWSLVSSQADLGGSLTVQIAPTSNHANILSSSVIALDALSLGISDYVGMSNHILRSRDSPNIGPETVTLYLYANGVAQGQVTVASGAYNIDGVTTTRRNFTTVNGYASNQWLNAGTATDYTVKASWTQVLGTVAPSGTLGSWIRLGTSTVSWSLTTGNDDADGNLFLQFSTVASGNTEIIDTANVTMIVIASP